jgi:site-specific DNA recombinase
MSYVGYIRVSTDEQVRLGVSLDVQESKIRDYAKLNDLDLVNVIRDEGRSGKDLKRPGMEEIVFLAKDKKIKGVIVYKLDRLSRKVLDTLNLIEMFDKQGVAFHSITERIDTKSAMGRFFITILSALAQMERDMISERTKGALNYKRQNGGLAGTVPYGYTSKGIKKEAILSRDDYEQRILDTIKHARSIGGSYNKIAEVLNKEGIPSRCGGSWYPQTVKSILQHSQVEG